MPDDHACRGTLDERVKLLLATCGGRLASLDDLISAIGEAGRGKRWRWVDKWVEEEGPKWVNDMNTVVFEFPSEALAAVQSLGFTQMVWRSQPRDFWFEVWAGRCFVRMWWEPGRVEGKDRT